MQLVLYKMYIWEHKKEMKLFICSLALSLAFEGVFFALFPEIARKCMLEACSLPEYGLRKMGTMALFASILLACATMFL